MVLEWELIDLLLLIDFLFFLVFFVECFVVFYGFFVLGIGGLSICVRSMIVERCLSFCKMIKNLLVCLCLFDVLVIFELLICFLELIF